MKKVLVIGCPGGGKSTFARRLRDVTGLPLIHLDLLYWNSDKTTVTREVFDSRLEKVLAEDAWIIDGNYARTMERRLQKCDTVYFLDLPTETCLAGIWARVGTSRPDMPWVEQDTDREFVEFVKNFFAENRPKILKLLETYGNKNILVFNNHAEAEEHLQALKRSCYGK